MTWLRELVWNSGEQRPRALWRLVLHIITLIAIAWTLSVVTRSLGLGGAGGLSWFGAVMTAITVGLGTWLCGRFLDRRELGEFGLRLSPRWAADLCAGLGIGVALMAGIFVLELQAGWLTIEGYYVGAGPGQAFAVALLDPLVTFVAVAFYEELFSRGYHLRNLAEGLRFANNGLLGPGTALLLATLLSSSVFGLMHMGNANASAISTINVGLAGCMLALGLVWTGELALPIGLHLSWNFFQGNVFGFPVSGNAMGPRVFDVTQAGDPLVTGGAFGPEAGLVGLAAMLAGVGLMAAWVRVTRGELRWCSALTQPSAAITDPRSAS
ncbi:putative metal-dependent membrane protease [Enhygromyxa salina]|uniref:Putative metal-dependent membrane protease n=1 Tax=Enhygromyxa salina TaxID=215803 RepID=A0A0C1ZKA7_9BACT|nr:CPBP family intramembrane glutamic endopeptidase [Enhygromyxa salina]KIG17919.1 putative metal-dependent membrane protease [Enhygromyxa salina]